MAVAKVIKPLILLFLSTFLYYLGVLIVDMKGYDISIVDKKFYLFYSVYTSGLLLTIAAYATVLYSETPVKNLKPKLIYLYLMIAEIYTFAKHVINKILGLDIYRGNSILTTLGIFSIFSVFVILRALKHIKSEEFKPDRTYIVNYYPKDFKGLINYLITCSGHKAIYQDGFITGFDKSTGTVIQKIAIPEKLINTYLKEIPRIRNLNPVVGKKWNLIKFNCNHLITHATRN